MNINVMCNSIEELTHLITAFPKNKNDLSLNSDQIMYWNYCNEFKSKGGKGVSGNIIDMQFRGWSYIESLAFKEYPTIDFYKFKEIHAEEFI